MPTCMVLKDQNSKAFQSELSSLKQLFITDSILPQILRIMSKLKTAKCILNYSL